MSSYLLSLYKKKINLRLVLGVFLLGLSLFVLLFFKSSIYNYVKGPLKVTPQVIKDFENNDSKVYFVSFEAKDLTPLDVERRTDGEVSTAFYALTVDDKYLLVELPTDFKENTLIEGCFRPFTTKLKDSILTVHPEYKSKIDSDFYGLVVNATANPTNKALFAYGLILLLFTSGISIVIYCIKLMKTPCEINILNKGYDKNDRAELLRTIDYDLNHTGFKKIGNAHVGNHWIIIEDGLSISLLCLDDIVWAYRLLDGKRSLSSNTGCKLFDKYGESYVLKIPLKVADGVLEDINTRTPWVTIGYSNQLDDLWMCEKEEFIASVEDAKHQFSSQM